jgi:transposase
MSKSLLYHAFNIKGVEYRSTRYIGNKIIIKAETIDKTKSCPFCKSSWLIFKGKKTRFLHLPPIGRKRCVLELIMHRLQCKDCNHLWWPRLSFMVGSKRYARSFALTVLDLLQFATIRAVAEYLHVGWDLIKQIHKLKLAIIYRRQNLSQLVYLGIDEFSIHKGHSYMTIFVDLQTGRIIHAVEGRSSEEVAPFIREIARKSPKLKAIAIDMSQSYFKAIKDHLGHVDIVFDRYHISALVNRSIDDLRKNIQNQLDQQCKTRGQVLLFAHTSAIYPHGQTITN